MFDPHKPHPLLAQVPLTVSPFLSLPSAVTLPYTFRSVPTSLPPSVIPENGTEKPKYVTSASGHTAHPDDIVASCKALQDHLQNTRDAAEKAIKDWEQDIRDRDLAEKRRVAPGWLDRSEKILEPTKAASKASSDQNLLDRQPTNLISAPAMSPSREGTRFVLLPHRVTIEALNKTTPQPSMESLQSHPWASLALPDPQRHLISEVYSYILSMSSTRFSPVLSLTQSAPTKPISDLSLDKPLPNPILHFLDHPLQTWQSTVLFAMILACLILVSAFMGRRYMEALQLNHWDSYNNPLTLESFRSSESTVEIHDEGDVSSAVTGTDPFLGTCIRSRLRFRLSTPTIAIGEVYKSKIAQRRRASSARRDHDTTATASDHSHQK